MGENSKIEWTDHTFNPWVGCQRVSPGCEHCYAEAYARRVGHGSTKPALWGPAADRRVTSDANWRQPIKWDRDAAREGVRRRVFCASLADVFEDRPELTEPRARLYALIDATPHLDWLLLTKRPENAARLWTVASAGDHGSRHMALPTAREVWRPNVWLGTTVEDQRRADERIPHLLAVPAAVRFLSCEPLLGPVSLARWMRSATSAAGEGLDTSRTCDQCGWSPFVGWPIEDTRCPGAREWGDCDGTLRPAARIDWVIAGGESGPGARPMHPDWARSLRDQCESAGVPFLWKQWGEWAPDCLCGGEKACRETPRPTPGPVGVMFRCGKAAAGRKLDGRTHDDVPRKERAR